ncbi:MAG: hypothetical protein Q9226_000018 [Calogaya cf. arnoldii]
MSVAKISRQISVPERLEHPLRDVHHSQHTANSFKAISCSQRNQLMFNASRRGSASLAKLARSPYSTRCLRFILPRPLTSETPRILPNLSACNFSTSHAIRQPAAQAAAIIENEIDHEGTAQGQPRHGPVTRFIELQERGMVCPTVVKTLVEDMKLETMTQVQSLTINETLKGGDVLAQARTGTGKTLAFLIPVLQNIINYEPKLEHRGYRQKRTSADDIRAIIISPTRELAEQIAVEARKLTRNTGVIVQTAVGGTQKSAGLRAIKNEGCHILVGTPGRLNDILSDPYSQVRAPDLSAFVLDEADRLLDQGFAPDIEAIQKLLPARTEVDRQTLLFSATVPREVVQIARRTAKPDVHFLRTVQEGELQTHERVPQKIAVIHGLENQAPALVELCKREIARQGGKPFKAIVYFNATADIELMASTLRNLKNPGESLYHKHPLHPAKIIHIHGQLTQAARTYAADTFRRAESAIMVSTDVTARGMDFPNVSHVIQMGVPQDRDSYIHRLGRTGRGDKTGEGWLILTDLERREARHRLHKLPITEDTSLEAASVDMTRDAQLPEDVAKTLTQTIDASRMIPLDQKCGAYYGSLGVMRFYPKDTMIASLNNRAKYCWDRALMAIAADSPETVAGDRALMAVAADSPEMAAEDRALMTTAADSPEMVVEDRALMATAADSPGMVVEDRVLTAIAADFPEMVVAGEARPEAGEATPEAVAMTEKGHSGDVEKHLIGLLTEDLIQQNGTIGRNEVVDLAAEHSWTRCNGTPMLMR